MEQRVSLIMLGVPKDRRPAVLCPLGGEIVQAHIPLIRDAHTTGAVIPVGGGARLP